MSCAILDFNDKIFCKIEDSKYVPIINTNPNLFLELRKLYQLKKILEEELMDVTLCNLELGFCETSDEYKTSELASDVLCEEIKKVDAQIEKYKKSKNIPKSLVVHRVSSENEFFKVVELKSGLMFYVLQDTYRISEISSLDVNASSNRKTSSYSSNVKRKLLKKGNDQDEFKNPKTPN